MGSEMCIRDRLGVFGMGVVEGTREQGFRIALDRGERGPKFVRNIGHKVRPDGFEPFDRGQIVAAQHISAGWWAAGLRRSVFSAMGQAQDAHGKLSRPPALNLDFLSDALSRFCGQKLVQHGVAGEFLKGPALPVFRWVQTKQMQRGRVCLLYTSPSPRDS